MPDVRVHVRLGAVRLDFSGELSFYEKHVEGLVEAAAAAGVRAPARTPSSGSNGEASSVGGPAASASTASSADATRAKPQGFVPQSGEFGRFLRRIGREAVQPDQQVVGIAFYLWLYEKRETFGREEIEGCYRAVGLSPPEGLEAILEDVTERKRFLEPGGAGLYRLSRKGENYVKTRLLSGATA